MGTMKRFSDLLEEVKKVPVVKQTTEDLRESFIRGDIFNVGDLVECDLGIVEIINRGPNYVTVISEDTQVKKWLTDIHPTEKQTRLSTSRLHKEAITVKGYKTKNFTRELAEQFSTVYKETGDKYALYNCTICCDKLLGSSKEGITENFDQYRVSFERAHKYLDKFNIKINEFSEIEDWLIEYAILEGLSFRANDKLKVARIIATHTGVVTESVDPVKVIHEAIALIKKNRYIPEAWKIMGNMFNLATSSGIKWNKDLFAKHTQHYMELK